MKNFNALGNSIYYVVHHDLYWFTRYGSKEVLRLKSFDYLLANEEKSKSQDITIVTIDEEAIEKYGQWFRFFQTS